MVKNEGAESFFRTRLLLQGDVAIAVLTIDFFIGSEDGMQREVISRGHYQVANKNRSYEGEFRGYLFYCKPQRHA
ncbi:hypothetical protein CTZ24_23915 (plasmid) [Pantoea phytobeneficialis]|uniref:Uncharacterized protein n=1 Tax=Pantoea phytobeneficialis TaxID=2052056 RepID=A0AAP9HA76_9GAMM|nr:hypothetical protein CTZ24_23915 [Pantoea phytobeneficialis]